MKKLQLLQNYVAIKPLEIQEEATHVGGVIIPTANTAYSKGIVTHVSDQVKYIPIDSTVVYRKGRGMDYTLDDQALKLLEVFDIIAIENEQE